MFRRITAAGVVLTSIGLRALVTSFATSVGTRDSSGV